MIGDTETALLDAVKGLFGNTLRDVDTHPGTWDDVAIKRMLLSEPAVYLAWLGCGPGRTSREVESHWVLYVCASMLNGREGDRLGIYQIVERLVAGINWKTFGSTTGMKLTKGQNLYTDAQGGAGCALYGLYFSGTTPIDTSIDLSSLDDYERHWQTWKQPDGTPPFEAHINVNEKQP
ncbi:phage protein Gp37 [Kluyvera georgiana]|uniref:phage protein Gp37 n=1 Tax=Kluyvera georgiana TaxID=73098 RepID=UPI003AF00B07